MGRAALTGVLFVVLGAAASPGCIKGTSEVTADAAIEAGADSSTDGSADTTPDAEPDIPVDVVSDAEPDTTVDVAPDGALADADATTDGTDALDTADGDGGDGGDPCAQDHCVLDDGTCAPEGPVSGTTCLRCDPAVSRFDLQADDTLCANAAGTCQVATCDAANDTCDVQPAADGTLCEDGSACTDNDQCNSGNCESGPAKDCSSAVVSPCHVEACDASDGTCSEVPDEAGTACDDAEACTDNDQCQGGNCIGTAISGCLVCTIDDDCDDGNPCTTGTCGADGLCAIENVTVDTACDTDLCQVGQVCDGDGACGPGTPLTCNPPTEDCLQAVCVAGVCTTEPAPAATECDDGLPCTTGGCDAGGSCVVLLSVDTGCLIDGACEPDGAANPANPCEVCAPGVNQNAWSPNDQATCDDGDACTLNDTCNGDTCEGTVACQGVNVMFVASGQHDGDLGGVTGADAICQDEALAAGLGGTFMAFLGDSGTSAYDRVAATGAGGWIRVDGQPVAADLDAFAAGEFWYPPSLDVDSQSVDRRVWTGALQGGALSSFTCSDWGSSDPSDEGSTGDSESGGQRAIQSGADTCETGGTIRCLQVDFTDPVAAPTPVPGRVAFVSSDAFFHDAGLEGADALCAADAVAGNLPAGEYRALLATSTTAAIDRFDVAGAEWVRPDGVPVAGSAADFADGATGLLAAIALRADGSWTDGGSVTTGAPAVDASDANTCSDWSDATDTSMFLAAPAASVAATWFASSSPFSCNANPNRVHCLQARPYNVAFVTTQTYAGDLGGLEGADALCQDAANQAGYTGTFKAWLSDGTAEAKARFLVEGANGWVRPDGKPVALNLDAWAEGRLWYPALLDQAGALVDDGAGVWSGTSPSGAAAGATCNNWQDDSDATLGLTGLTEGGNLSHQYLVDAPCDLPRHLRCLQVDHDEPVTPPAPMQGRLAFLSSQAFDLASGLDGADALCQADAVAAGLPRGRYKALLSDSATAASDRFNPGLGPWIRTDGLLVNATVADFFDPSVAPIAPIGSDAFGNPVQVGNSLEWPVFGGADLTDVSTESCNDWSSVDGANTMRRAISGAAVADWTSGFADTCDTGPARVVCLFDQPFNVAFTTLQTFNGDLGGVLGADQKCQAAADAQPGLEGTFMAWISDDGKAYDRILATGANGWVRPDGRIVAETLDAWHTGRQIYPANLTENGIAVNTDVWTGTLNHSANGQATTDCQNWASSVGGDSGLTGLAASNGVYYTHSQNRTCNTVQRLRCLQVDYDNPVPLPPPAPGRVAFVGEPIAMSVGVAALDQHCDDLADGVLPPGEYKALVATSTTPALDPSRFDLDGPLWVRADGVPINATMEDFLDPAVAPEAPMNLRNNGASVIISPTADVATGAPNTSSLATANCSDFTGSGMNLRLTRAGYAGTNWFNYIAANASCGGTRRVFCLQNTIE